MPDTDLFAHLADDVRSEPAKDLSIDGRYQVWLARNPEVLEEFVRLAREAKDRGMERIGAKTIAEVLRWSMFMKGDVEGFKLNNVYVSRMARQAIAEHPELDGLFELRKLTSS